MLHAAVASGASTSLHRALRQHSTTFRNAVLYLCCSCVSETSERVRAAAQS